MKSKKCLEGLKNEYDLKVVENMTIIDELRNVELLLRNQGSNNITFNTQYCFKCLRKRKYKSYITSDYVKLLINNGPIQSIPKLMEHIHFNPRSYRKSKYTNTQ